MAFSFKRFFIGAALIAASVFVPGLPSLVAQGLFLAGAGAALGAFAPSIADPIRAQTEGSLIQSANTLNHLPIIYSATGVRVAGKVVFLDTRNTKSDDTRGTDGTNALADMAIAACLGNRAPVPGETNALATKTGPLGGFGSSFVSPEEAGIGGFGDVYFDDRLVYTAKKEVVLRAFRFFVVGEGPLVADDLIDPIVQYHGHETQAADPYLLELNTILNGGPVWAHGDSEWTEDHRGGGVAYMVLGLWWHKDFLTSIPNITVVMRGRQVRRLLPVTGIRTWQVSSNPAECIYDYLLEPRSGAATRELREIAQAWFAGTAEYCEQIVTNLDATEGPRYTLDGAVDTGRSVQENLRDMLTTFGGVLDWSMGKWYLRHHDPNRAPVMDLNEHNIIGDWTWHIADAESQANLVVGQYPEPTPYDSGLADDLPDLSEGAPTTALREEIEQVQFPQPHLENPYLVEDNDVEVVRTIDLPMTRDAQIATRRCAEELFRSRADLTVTLTAKEEAARLALLDRVTITHPRPGWVQKPFWVNKLTLNPDQTVGLVLREDHVSPGIPPPTEPVELLGQPFEIIQVPSNEARPPRVWITLPFGRVDGAMLAIIDLPDFTIDHRSDPINATLDQSYWAACYIPSKNEVWTVNNSSNEAKIHVRNATTKDLKYVRNMGSLLNNETVYDMEYYAGDDTVILGTSGGVYKLALDTQVVLDGPLTTALQSFTFGDPMGVQNNIFDVVQIGSTLWAAISLHDFVWYFNPLTMQEDDTLAWLDGPIGGLIDPGGEWLNQADTIGNALYHAPAALSSIRTWEQGTATGAVSPGPGTSGLIEQSGTFNFVEHCPTLDQGDLLALSQGSGSVLFPSDTGALVVHRPGGGSNVSYALTFHPGRTVYVPELNWVVVTSLWRSTTFGAPAKLAQAIPIGEVPPNAPGGTPPFTPPDDEFDDPDAPPEPGPDDNVADPNEPNVTPTIAAVKYCEDEMVETSTDVFEGTVDEGWRVTLTDADFPAGTEGTDFEAKDHPHEVVGWNQGDNPEIDPPAFRVPIPVPVEGQTYQGSVFKVSGRFVDTPPACGGPSDVADKTYDIYVRRRVQGFLPGPLSNKVTLTFEHPGPQGNTSFPPDPGGVGAPTASTSSPRCLSTVTGSTDDRSGLVRVFGEVRFREDDNGDDLPIEIYEMAEDDDPDVDTPIKTYLPGTVSGRVFVRTDDVHHVEFSHVLDADVPTCGKTHPTEPDVRRDYYARHLTASGPRTWSSRLRLTYKYPGPAGKQDDQGGGWAPLLLDVRDIKCRQSGRNVEVFVTLQVVVDQDSDNPFKNINPRVYIMEVGEHPDTDETANMPTGQAFSRNGIIISSSSLTDVMIARVVYADTVEADAADCQAGSVLHTFDMYIRHESPTKGNSDWLGPVTLQYRLSTDPA